jgi:cytosine/adenosine deaminase-related metal-dependent hydrolase
MVVAHIVAPFGMRPTFDKLAAAKQFGSDNLFIHMTGMSDLGWNAVRDAGAHVSLATPIEMVMRHGMPPILKALSLGIQPSLSTDVEVTLTADMFTQMRATMGLQRALVNQIVLDSVPTETNPYPPPPPGTPPLLRTQDVLRYATIEGARDLRLDHKVGALTPGKEADIIILDAEAINVAPLNIVPGDGTQQCRDGDRRRQDSQVERKAAGRQPQQAASGAGGVARLRLQGGGHRAGSVQAELNLWTRSPFTPASPPRKRGSSVFEDAGFPLSRERRR